MDTNLMSYFKVPFISNTRGGNFDTNFRGLF